MKARILPLLVLLFLASSTALAQQQGTVKGKVTGDGESLPGVNVVLKGSSIGTITDFDGNYELNNLPANAEVTLLFSFVGYSSTERTVTTSANAPQTLDIELSADALALDQVVVTGVVNPRSSLESSLALTTLNSKFVSEFGAQTTAELFKAIPGIRSESSGGEGNANIAVRGIPVASGGAKFLQLHEDGLPVLQFGDISFGNADIFLRADQSVARIEAIKGGSASIFASNSPAGIINFISNTGAVAGGSVGTSIGLDYESFRTDFAFGSPIGNGLRFHVGGFFRQGEGQRQVGYTGNYGGQVKANLTKEFENGYARIYFKYLNDRAVSYMPMPVKVTGTADQPNYESVPGFDLTRSALQSPLLQNILSVDGQGNSRTSNVGDGMHPVSVAVGGEFSFELGEGWRVQNKARMAFTHGSFNSPFPAQVTTADALATDLAGAGYTLSYANGPNAGVALSPQQVQNLNGNGLLMRIHLFDTQMDNLNNFTNDLFVSKAFDRFSLTAGYYKAYQRIGMTWLWQSFLTDLSDQYGARPMNISNATGEQLTTNGLSAHGVPFWGNCCTRGYDVGYAIDAPYANVEVDITDQIKFDGGVRWDFGSANGYYLGNTQAPVDVNRNGSLEAVEQSVTVLDNANAKPVNYDFNYLSYSMGLNYKLADNKAIYARYSQGGRANADRLLYSPFLQADGNTIEGLSADKVAQAELGFKYNSARRSLIATAFYTTISEQNEEFGRAINKNFSTMGVELEGSVRYANFNLSTGLTYTRARIDKSLNPEEEGNVPRRVPALLYNLSPSYSFAQNRASVGFSLVGTTRVYAQDDNNIVIPGYLYANAFAGFQITKGLSLRANVNNLSNTLGFTEMEGDPFVANATNYLRARPIQGRSTTLSVVYNF